jgi:hypothetical protein
MPGMMETVPEIPGEVFSDALEKLNSSRGGQRLHHGVRRHQRYRCRFHPDPASGKVGASGDYLANAQGEDVVAGIRNTLSLDDLASSNGSFWPTTPRARCGAGGATAYHAVRT